MATIESKLPQSARIRNYKPLTSAMSVSSLAIAREILYKIPLKQSKCSKFTANLTKSEEKRRMSRHKYLVEKLRLENHSKLKNLTKVR